MRMWRSERASFSGGRAAPIVTKPKPPDIENEYSFPYVGCHVPVKLGSIRIRDE
jgi:hypothetical protein